MSTRQLTDVTQLVTDTYTYDAFGLLLDRSGATENNYLYTGEQYDPNVGFYYLRARYYNASIGRFLTMDTWPGLMFEPLSLHKYLYCEGNPVNRWDPSGKLNVGSPLFGLVATIAVFFVVSMLAEIATVGLGFLISWIADAKIPVQWTGSLRNEGWALPWYTGFSRIIAHFKGSRKTTKGIEHGMGNYTIIVFGPSIGGPFTSAEGSAEVHTPGLFGANPKMLTGVVNWGSASYATEGTSVGGTDFYIGFGHGTISEEFGYSIGLALMVGLSFLSGPSYWKHP